VSFTSKLKTADFRELAPAIFYGVAGVILLVLLPLAGFPPHIGLTGVLSLVTAYGLIKKRFWAFWLVVALLGVTSVLSLYTLAVVGFSNALVALSMIAYVILTWAFTLQIALKRKAD
jgi:hypothetical protein